MGKDLSTCRVRPTLRCLQHDLGVALSLVQSECNLDDFVQAVLVTARSEIASGKTLQKVNTHPVGVKWYEIEQSNPEWRGVVWQDPADSDRYWLVSAGKHQEDGGNDFWKKLERNRDLSALQPTADDYKRHALEEPLRQAASFVRDAQEMCKAALSTLGVIQLTMLLATCATRRCASSGRSGPDPKRIGGVRRGSPARTPLLFPDENRVQGWPSTACTPCELHVAPAAATGLSGFR